MRYPVDLSLLRGTAHSPSLATLQRSMARDDLQLRDFCIPVNPYFPTPALFDRLRERLADVLKLYPSQNEQIAEVLADALGLEAERLVVANGSTELITWIDRLLVRDSIVVAVPTFGRWTDQALESGKTLHLFHRRADKGYQLDVDELAAFIRARGARAAALCNPNNPTGALLRPAAIAKTLRAAPRAGRAGGRRVVHRFRR